MQAASDIFLGWQRSIGIDGLTRDYYLRQLRDGKGSIDPAQMVPNGMTLYGRLCGATLARAHARSGDRVAVAAYLGKKDAFDQAIADFAAAYADRNARDADALADAVRNGRVTAVTGV
jgi:sugar/nucleoside kinase (ribokinase family)